MRASLLVRLVCAVIVALAANPANAELFNCIAENGKRVIQNMPCDGARITEPIPLSRTDVFGDAVSAYQRRDYAQAFRLWRRVAEEGNAQAQYNLGAMHANGDGVTQDYQEAAKWWKLAAAQGHALAQTNLNALYEKAQAGRDLLAQPPAGLLTDMAPTPASQTAPQAVASQPGIDLYAPSQTASPRDSILNRTIVGGIGGAALGALAGLFILVRALIKKFKAPATAEAMAIYRAQPHAVKIGAALLIGCTVLLVYFLFLRTKTVDDYLNDYQERIEKLQECREVPDMTKDRECMNAYTAQRMLILH